VGGDELESFVFHLVDEGEHTGLDAHSIDCVLGDSGVEFKILEAAVIVEESHHTKLLSFDTLESLYLINYLANQLFIIQLCRDPVFHSNGIILIDERMELFFRFLVEF
jgi:hypothetical protein